MYVCACVCVCARVRACVRLRAYVCVASVTVKRPALPPCLAVERYRIPLYYDYLHLSFGRRVNPKYIRLCTSKVYLSGIPLVNLWWTKGAPHIVKPSQLFVSWKTPRQLSCPAGSGLWSRKCHRQLADRGYSALGTTIISPFLAHACL